MKELLLLTQDISMIMMLFAELTSNKQEKLHLQTLLIFLEFIESLPVNDNVNTLYGMQEVLNLF